MIFLEEIKKNSLIEIVSKEIVDLNEFEKDDIVVIATGPLTSDSLSKAINSYIGQDELYFYDAAAPIVTKESLDMEKVYKKDRYGELGKGDYLNASMSEEEYNIMEESQPDDVI